ncbi:MAG: MBL fold metallo-hydrolase, partial [Lentisphaeria bacterium]|nr:MBL fold metallo-hydrolase [Lentisphaeria bacterium]
MEITIVTDLQDEPGFTSEFGLSLLLRTASGEYLFDTGAGTALEPNLRQLHCSASSIRQVILSHGHYDHTGGLASLQPEKIWCCPGIMEGHYS